MKFVCSKSKCDEKEFHGDQIRESMQLKNCSDDHVISYIKKICNAFITVLDSDGRSCLHNAIIFNKYKVTEFLISCGADVNYQETFNKFSPLHFAAIFGNIELLFLLLKHGADAKLSDRMGFNVFYYVSNLLPQKVFERRQGHFRLEPYSWGINNSFNLGLNKIESCAYPEQIQVDFGGVENVSMNKYHTVFKTSSKMDFLNYSKVFCCGHSHGGRLGLKTEGSVVLPTENKKLSQLQIYKISAGLYHTLFLSDKGILSCGQNQYHQLGLNLPLSHEEQYPKFLEKFNSRFTSFDFNNMGIEAASYHSIFWTDDDIFSCGLNAGQLGHEKTLGMYIDVPTPSAFVKKIDKKECGDIKYVSTSAGATVFSTIGCAIFLCNIFEIKRLPFLIRDVKKIMCFGGKLIVDEKNCPLKEINCSEIKIGFLTKHFELFIWKSDSDESFLKMKKEVHMWFYDEVLDFALHANGVCLTNRTGQVLDAILDSKSALIEDFFLPNISFRPTRIDRFVRKLSILKVIPFLCRSCAIFSDPKGLNFVSLQYEPQSFVYEIRSTYELKYHLMEKEQFFNDFSNFYISIFESENFDLEVVLEEKSFYVNRYILSYYSSIMHSNILRAVENENSGIPKLYLNNVHPEPFEKFVKFMYKIDGTSIDFRSGFLTNEGRRVYILHQKISGRYVFVESLCKDTVLTEYTAAGGKRIVLKYPLKSFVKLCLKLEMDSILNFFVNLHVQKGVDLSNPDHYSEILKEWDDLLQFHREELKDLYDVSFKCSDGQILKAHKCIVVARSSYFQTLLHSRWNSKSNDPIDIQVSSKILKYVLNTMYICSSYVLDEWISSIDGYDLNFLCELFSVAHLYMFKPLQHLCQIKILELVSLKNAFDVLKLGLLYNGKILIKFAASFICHNLSFYVHYGQLKNADSDVIEALRSSYYDHIESLTGRDFGCPDRVTSADNNNILLSDDGAVDSLNYHDFYDDYDERSENGELSDGPRYFFSSEENDSESDTPKKEACKSPEKSYYLRQEPSLYYCFPSLMRASHVPTFEELEKCLNEDPSVISETVEDWMQMRDANDADISTENSAERRKKSKKRTRKRSTSLVSTGSNSELDVNCAEQNELFSFDDLEDKEHESEVQNKSFSSKDQDCSSDFKHSESANFSFKQGEENRIDGRKYCDNSENFKSKKSSWQKVRSSKSSNNTKSKSNTPNVTDGKIEISTSSFYGKKNIVSRNSDLSRDNCELFKSKSHDQNHTNSSPSDKIHKSFNSPDDSRLSSQNPKLKDSLNVNSNTGCDKASQNTPCSKNDSIYDSASLSIDLKNSLFPTLSESLRLGSPDKALSSKSGRKFEHHERRKKSNSETVVFTSLRPWFKASGNPCNSLNTSLNENLDDSNGVKTRSHTACFNAGDSDPVAGTSGQSPWKAVKEVEMDEDIFSEKRTSDSFSSIVQEELAHKKALENEQKKPLHLIQLEERAMKELFEFYGGEFNPEERISVFRSEKILTKPSWNVSQNKKKI